MEKAITSGSVKASGQHMEHEQIEEIFSRDSTCSVFPGFGMKIPEGDHTVLATENVLFLDNASVQVLSKINEGLVAVADIFTVNDPLLRTISWDLQAIVDKGLQELCPEDFCQGLMIEEIIGRFRTPQSCFHVDACPRHDDMDVRVIVKCP